MIVGIGTDLVDCRRIAGVYQRFGQRFAEKILAPDERPLLPSGDAAIGFLAKRFAAKEAVAKALGVGIGGRAGLHDIVVLRNADGAPQLQLCGAAQVTAEQLGVSATHISLSDEQQMALAFVVLSR